MHPAAGVEHRSARARSPLREIVASERTRTMGVPEDHMRGAQIEPVENLGEGQQRSAAELFAGDIGPQRAEPRSVERADQRREGYGHAGAANAAPAAGSLERAPRPHLQS